MIRPELWTSQGYNSTIRFCVSLSGYCELRPTSASSRVVDERESEHSNSVLLSPDVQREHNMQYAEIIAYLRDIDADIHAIRVEVDRATEAVRKSKNPIIRSLFPWL